MPRRYRPGARAAAPNQYTPSACKAARRYSIACLLGRSSSPEKRHRRDTDDEDGYDESDASLPSKKPKLEDQDDRDAVNIDDVQDPERLKTYLIDALVFINKLGVAPKAPATLRPLLMARPEAASSMAASIRHEMRRVSGRLFNEIYHWKATGTTSDDISAAMTRFLPEIEELMELPSQDALKLSYDLVIGLSQSSYGDLDMPKSCGYGDRPSDEPADLLLRKLIRKRLAAGETWD